MAVINIKSGQTIVNGTSVEDQINLKESVGNGIVINANAGNDTITVTRGDNHTINAGAGADFVTVATGKNYKINLGDGNDRVDLLGAEGHQVVAVAGTNNINVNNGDSYVITGGTGIDRLTIKGTNSNIKADLGAGADVLGMATGSGNQIHGGADNDYFIISGGDKGTFYGDAGDDTIRLYRGEGHEVYAGEGNDSMLVTEANNSKVYGVSGKNQIMFFGGTGNEYYGGDEKDNITLKNKAEAVKVTGGTNATVINIQTGDQHIIDLSNSTNTVTQIMAGANTKVTGGKGKDTLRVWGTTEQLTADLGAGNDLINVKGGEEMTLRAGDGNDELQILGGSRNTYYAGSGDDRVAVSGGTSREIRLGEGDDQITVSGGTVASLQTNSGNNTIKVQDEGIVEHLYLGSNGDKETIRVEGGRIEVVMNSFSSKVDFTMTGGYASNAGCGAENDWVELKGGTLKKVELGGGDDYIEVTGGAIENNRIYGDAGNDTFQIYVSGLKLYGGTGDDVFNVNSPLTDEVSGTIVGGEGNDRVNITGSHYTIQTEDGDDTVTIGSGSTDLAVSLGEGKDISRNLDENAVLSKIEVRGEGGNDEIELRCRLDHSRIAGEAGEDLLYVGNNKKIGDYNVLDGGDGKDEITCYNNHHGVVVGGQGNDIIVVSQFAYGVIYGDSCYSATSDTCGIDSITLTDVNECFINGSDSGRYTTTEDNNTIRIYGKNTRNIIFGGCGENLIRVEGTLTNSIIMCGHKKDEISIMGKDSKYNAIFGGDGNDDYNVTGGSYSTFRDIAGTNRFTISGGSRNAYLGGRDSDYYYVNSGVQSYNLLRGGSAEDAYYVDSTAKVMIDVETDSGIAMNKVSIFGAKASELTIKVDKRNSIIQINDILIKGGNCDFYFGASDMFGTGTKYGYTAVRDLKVGKASEVTDLLTNWNTYYAEMGTGGKAISGAELSNSLAPVLSNVELDITKLCQTYAK